MQTMRRFFSSPQERNTRFLETCEPDRGEHVKERILGAPARLFQLDSERAKKWTGSVRTNFSKKISVFQKPCVERGFTIIEILIVMAVMVMLMLIIFGSISTSRQRARDIKRVTDIKEIQIELALYYDVNRAYPNALSALVPGYIGIIPTNPSGSPYSYQYDSATNKYCIGVVFEQFTASNVDGYVNCTINGSSGNFYKTQQ